LILLYWDIGHAIVEKQQTARWGDSVVEQLAADLRAEFPHIRGFSANNLWLMRQLYSEYACQEFLEQLVQELAIMGALVSGTTCSRIGQYRRNRFSGTGCA
jgi:hypothetical protein